MKRRTFLKSQAIAGITVSAAPAILQGKDDRRVRLGFIGIGGRGTGLLKNYLPFGDVDIPAVCDIAPKNLTNAQNLVEQSGRPRPAGYGEHEYSYLDMLERDDLDGTVIASPWELHIPMAIASMKAGKYAAHEVGPASSVDECWELVKTFEETRVPSMCLENYCYFRYNMAVLNMVRQGLFGELIHCTCGYGHDLRERLVLGKGTGPTPKGEGDYRSMHNEFRNGDLYPTHGLGPIAQCLNIQRGNRFLYLTSTSTKSRSLSQWSEDNLAPNHPRRNIEWRQGDIVTTTIKCQNGETIGMTFDTRLPRPTTFLYSVQGTKGIWMQDGDSSSKDKSAIYLEGRSPDHQWESFDRYQEEYEHPVWKKHLQGEITSGHGGTDKLELLDFVKCIKQKTDTPIDVYDGAAWMAIAPLSEASVSMGSMPVEVPDFTNGQWMVNKPKFGVADIY
jgi:hypothetical protein